jgi:hypothetical protein
MGAWFYPDSKPLKDRWILLMIKEEDGTLNKIVGIIKKSEKNQRLFHSCVDGNIFVDTVALKRAALWRYLEEYEIGAETHV